DYVRGHEGDPWKTWVDPTWMGTPTLPARSHRWWMHRVWDLEGPEEIRGYDISRTFIRAEEDFPGPKTMNAAASWLREATPHHDRWMLFVDEFDPHEPFDTPDPWLGRYEDEPWDGELIVWPPYADGALTEGSLEEREARHVRANYGSKLSMIDHWFGRMLDALDEGNLWDTTAVVVCTDHGHYLGEEREERDIWGKPAVIQYEPLGHPPLLVHWPGVEGGGTCDALTTAVDVHATLVDVFGVEPTHRTHGESLVPLLTGQTDRVREWALGGIYGNWVQVTDGRRKYARGAVDDNFPLSMWSNRWSSMPIHFEGINGLPDPDDRARLDKMPGSTIPVIRQPFEPGDMLPMWAFGGVNVDRNFVFDLDVDPDEQENRTGGADEAELIDLLRAALDSVDAPDDQYARLGLS
ncbi:MAG: sulfatase-like hydrolase/transferase, partial [Microthrixaceae bacterium]